MLGLIFSYFTMLHVIYSCTAEYIIIDTDAGADDAIAILMLLRAEALNESPFKIIAITCTYGNTKEENVEKNVIEILSFANRTDIPVYGGARRSLLPPDDFRPESIYGSDGFGESKFSLESTNKTIESIHASLAMVELAKKHEGNVSIVVLGPPTNVALAASFDYNFVRRVKKFHALGSSVAALGNYKANVEFNFGADPEANLIFLNSTKSSQLSLLPWETAFHAQLPMDWRQNFLGKKTSPYVNFINKVEKVSWKICGDTYVSADSMTISTMLWPRIVKSSIEVHVQVVTDGVARGSVLVEYPRVLNPSNKPRNVRIIQSIDVELFKEALVYYLTCERVDC